MNERCDRCNARAKTVAELKSGQVLYLCQHHTNEHANALLDQGAVLTSEREKVPF